MAVVLTNNARSTLAADVADTDTTISVQGADAAKFPLPATAEEWFPVTVVKADTTFEIMRCTERVGAVLTVERGHEGTTAKAFVTGDLVQVRMTAAAFDEKADKAATDALILQAAPPGACQTFARDTAPDGWLKCNGAAVSRTTYAALFAAIGATFGNGDGTTTFNLPDLRGEFVRGWDDGRGIDTGRAFGSAQGDQNKAHTHSASTGSAGGHTHTASSNTTGAHEHTGTALSAGAHTHTASTGSAGSHTHTGSANSAGAHIHYFAAGTSDSGEYDYGVNLRSSTSLHSTTSGQPHRINTSSEGAHTHSLSINSNGAHTHSVTVNSAGAHTHSLDINSAGAHSHTITVDAVGGHTHSVTVESDGGTEARPRNIALLWCIKT